MDVMDGIVLPIGRWLNANNKAFRRGGGRIFSYDGAESHGGSNMYAYWSSTNYSRGVAVVGQGL